MASPAILYRGCEVDSVYPISGTLSGSNNYIDDTYSVAGISIGSASVGGIFRESDGSATDVSGGDTLWSSFYFGKGANSIGQVLSILDIGGREAIRVYYPDSSTFQLQHNNSATATPSWQVLAQYGTGANNYFAFRIKTGAAKTFGLYVGGNLISEGEFSNTYIGNLTRFVFGPFGGAADISQMVFSRDVAIVGARVWTRKANSAGTYSQMLGTYSNLVKIVVNDGTGVSSSVAGQMFTSNYQDVVIPDGLEMHPEVAVWSRARNDGSDPTMFKPVYVVDGVLQKGASLPLDVGFSAVPYILSGMNQAKFNSCEIGMESADT